MKICISSTVDKENAVADRRFGRCPFYAIYDNEKSSYAFIDNSAVAESHGAGLKAAQTVVDAGVDVVITGNVGPNAMRVLEASKIKVYELYGNKVNEQVQHFTTGDLNEITTPGTPHMGMGGNEFGHKR